jgi:hypothetical protein
MASAAGSGPDLQRKNEVSEIPACNLDSLEHSPPQPAARFSISDTGKLRPPKGRCHRKRRNSGWQREGSNGWRAVFGQCFPSHRQVFNEIQRMKRRPMALSCRRRDRGPRQVLQARGLRGTFVWSAPTSAPFTIPFAPSVRNRGCTPGSQGFSRHTLICNPPCTAATLTGRTTVVLSPQCQYSSAAWRIVKSQPIWLRFWQRVERLLSDVGVARGRDAVSETDEVRLQPYCDLTAIDDPGFWSEL